jgi:hypothetical protein
MVTVAAIAIRIEDKSHVETRASTKHGDDAHTDDTC